MTSSLNNIECDGNLFLLESVKDAPEQARVVIGLSVRYDRERCSGDYKKFTGGILVFEEPFSELSTEAQSFVLYHEMGHIVIPEALPATQYEYSSNSLTYEKLADEYVISKIGKDAACRALREIETKIKSFINLIPWNDFNMMIEEIKDRIKIIEKYGVEG